MSLAQRFTRARALTGNLRNCLHLLGRAILRSNQEGRRLDIQQSRSKWSYNLEPTAMAFTNWKNNKQMDWKIYASGWRETSMPIVCLIWHFRQTRRLQVLGQLTPRWRRCSRDNVQTIMCNCEQLIFKRSLIEGSVEWPTCSCNYTCLMQYVNEWKYCKRD